MYRDCVIFFLLLLSFSTSTHLFAQNQTQRLFAFGHSLIDHRPPAIPTPSDETTVPHWLAELSQAAGHTFAAGGQYGFLPQHARLPPISQWGYDMVDGVWESDTETFGEADITTILMTAGNFMQWQGPTEEYPSDPGVSPVSATETIMDWTAEQEPGVRHYIYENWPDMASYLENGFPPSTQELSNYDNYTVGNFHQWWLDYQDVVLASRPALQVRMIPVGPLISRLLTDELTTSMPVTELYEDDAPHGRATVYFLASLVTYMAIYQERAPSNFQVPNTVHVVVRDSYSQIVDFFWEELLAFNLPSGESRVFFDMPNNTREVGADELVQVYPNPTTDAITLSRLPTQAHLQLTDVNGRVRWEGTTAGQKRMPVDLSQLPAGIYLLQVTDKEQGNIQQVFKICRM